MEHPMIRQIQLYGYPEKEDEPLYYDYFDNPVYKGDIVYELDGTKFLKETLSRDAQEILEWMGATQWEAQEWRP